MKESDGLPETEFRCMMHDRWLHSPRMRWTVFLLVAAAGLFVAAANAVPDNAVWIALASFTMAGTAVASFFHWLLSTTQNRIRLYEDRLVFVPALAKHKYRIIPYGDVERLVYNGVVVSVIARDRGELTFQPYRLVTEDVFEAIRDYVLDANPDCTIVDRSS